MPLSLATLESEFLAKVFDNPHPTFAAAGAAWASAYRVYAEDAISCIGASPIPATLDAAEAALSAALASAFALGFLAPVTANAMDAAFVAFWFTVSFGGLPPAAPPGVIGAALIAQWVTLFDDAEAVSDIHAAIFDTWTRTVTVAHPPTCGGPIT